MRLKRSETFELLMGDLDVEGCLVALLVVREDLSREQAMAALAGERSTQLRLPGRDFGVTDGDEISFELLDPAGRSYRRYFLERTA
jgi:hypothetical protein